MVQHAPAGYECPFCAVVGGADTDRNAQNDVVLRDGSTTTFVSPRWWSGNEGHVLVVPNSHYENLYEIPDDVLAAVYSTTAGIARAIRESYGCEGTSTRQHNEPGGGQDVWHFHVHVYPRWSTDSLYDGAASRWATVEERAPFAELLRDRLAHYPPRS